MKILFYILLLPLGLVGQERNFNMVKTTIETENGIEEQTERNIKLSVIITDSTINLNSMSYKFKDIHVLNNNKNEGMIVLNNGELVFDERQMFMRTQYTINGVLYKQHQHFYTKN